MGYFETPAFDWISLKKLQQFRLFSILVLLPMMIVPIYLNDLTYLYRYLTQWSIEIATISMILIYFAAKNPDSLKLNKISLICFEIAIFLTIGTMVSFWSSFPNIYFCCIETYWIVALSISHIIPQFIILTNLFLTDIKIKLKDGIYGAIVGIAYLTELFMAWYSGVEYEQYAFYNRVTGPYWWAYWSMMTCNVISPQLFLFKKIRTNIAATFIISIIVNIGMWFERFVIIVTSLHRDYLPSSWAMFYPSIYDVGMYLFSFGFFFTAYLAFSKYFPVINMAEVKSILKQTGEKVKKVK